MVQGGVVRGEQQAAGALALMVWVDSQQGQMVVGGAGGMVTVERGVEGGELGVPPAGGGGEPGVRTDRSV